MKLALAGLCLVVFLSAAAPGQSAETPPSFEVADLRVSAPGTAERGGFTSGGRFDMRGTTMLTLIAAAYGVDTDMVVGGPAWLNSDRFDIIAKPPSPTPSPEIQQAMLQALLADRFKLAIRHEQKDMPVYFLVVGKKGPKLQPAAKPGEPDCPRVAGDTGMAHRGCRAYTMAALCELLPQVAGFYADHPVVDRTGLTGSYDFQLDWMSKAAYLAAKANPGDGPQPVSMFDALEKLGLKLEAGTNPAPVIVVAQVNRTPAENPPGVAAKIPDVPMEFEVAEVRPSKPGETQTQGRLENGRLELLGFPLKALIALAFDVEDYRVAGGPKWLDTDRFDVIAKAPKAVPEDAVQGMLKTLIVERFKLAFHNQDQPVPVFALTLGKRGPKLKEADGSVRSDCKLSIEVKGRTYTCQNTTMAQLAERLPSVAAAYIVHPMVDLTGLKGAYDFTLVWTGKRRLSGFAGRGGDAGAQTEGIAQASAPAGDLTVFEALDKQLGLKLEEQQHPMPSIMIDHVDRTPAEN
ncbi:MAG TPA: TIGR03435 family protein [Bryobacteraceae bacterium]|nr:TIGR03435 family protein [Bryobacteraceae bacterium]